MSVSHVPLPSKSHWDAEIYLPLVVETPAIKFKPKELLDEGSALTLQVEVERGVGDGFGVAITDGLTEAFAEVVGLGEATGEELDITEGVGEDKSKWLTGEVMGEAFKAAEFVSEICLSSDLF